MAVNSAFSQRVFTAPTGRNATLLTAMVQTLPREASIRILDIGCGTGQLLFELADMLPEATFVGVDISPASIEIASHNSSKRDDNDRFQWHASDYLTYQDTPFDAVVLDSVFHNIPGSTERLAGRVTADLKPGGRLYMTLPTACLYNRLLWALRSLLKRFQGPRLDGILMGLAARLHTNMNRALLEERIPYMYLIPYRIDNRALTHTLTVDLSLDLLERRPVPHASIAQPKHRLSIYRKPENIEPSCMERQRPTP